jgi:hypothetical protein
VFVGCDPAYARREDVRVQVGLARPKVRVTYDLASLAKQVQLWCPS